MSIDATRWAWRQQGLRPSDKLVLLSMADRAGEDHTCFPSKPRLEQDTGLDRKTIIKCWERLQESGLIHDTEKRVGHTGQVIVWQLNLEAEDSRERVPKTVRSQKRDAFKGSQNSQQRVPKTDAKGSQKRDAESIRESTKESIRGGSRKRENPKVTKPDLINQYQVEPEVADQFLEIRKAHKAPLTKLAMTSLVNQFKAANLTVNDGLIVCTVNGWRGFHAAWDWRTTSGGEMVLGKKAVGWDPFPM